MDQGTTRRPMRGGGGVIARGACLLVLAGLALGACESDPAKTERPDEPERTATSGQPEAWTEGWTEGAPEGGTGEATARNRQPVPTPEPTRMYDRVTKPNGLVIEDIMIGPGPVCMPGMTISVHYTARLESGVIFDETYGSAPAGGPLDACIPGWREGVPGMRIGGKRRLTIPPELAFGDGAQLDEDGNVVVPANETVIFEILLLDAQPSSG